MTRHCWSLFSFRSHRYSIKGRVYPAILPLENNKVPGKVWDIVPIYCLWLPWEKNIIITKKKKRSFVFNLSGYSSVTKGFKELIGYEVEASAFNFVLRKLDFFHIFMVWRLLLMLSVFPILNLVSLWVHNSESDRLSFLILAIELKVSTILAVPI